MHFRFRNPRRNQVAPIYVQLYYTIFELGCDGYFHHRWNETRLSFRLGIRGLLAVLQFRRPHTNVDHRV